MAQYWRTPLRLLGIALLWLLGVAATQASPLTLATNYHRHLNLQHYWVSEKYDGIRAHWTGTQLLSRQGLPLRPRMVYA